MNTDEHGLNDLSGRVIGCAFSVSSRLGAGFLEKVYTAQRLNYLRATGLRLCLLMNFGRPKLEVKRLIL